MNLDVQKQNFDFLEGQTRALVRWGQETFGAKVFLTSAFGINGSVLLELVRPILPDVEIFFIDTGCHFAETLELRDHFRQKGFNVVEIGSEPRGNGRDFEEIGHDLCCQINKVEPMNRLLAGRPEHLWITGLSRDQAETRRDIPFFQRLPSGVYKLSPLAGWRQSDIWAYTRQRGLIYNRLYDQGYASIGCRPCTTPVKPGEDLRAGRWRDTGKTECGLHPEKPFE